MYSTWEGQTLTTYFLKRNADGIAGQKTVCGKIGKREDENTKQFFCVLKGSGVLVKQLVHCQVLKPSQTIRVIFKH